MRLKLFLVGLALGIALWVTMSVQSFLYAFLIAFALLVLAVGTGMVLSDRDRPSATYTEADLDAITFAAYLDALDRITDGDAA